MKALIVPQAGKLEIADIPMPEIGPYDALVRIEVCGICNSTDQKLIEGTMYWAPPFPIVLGHESVGTVVEAGAKVRKFRVGDRVTRPIYVPPKGSGDLHSALGGFAEFGVVRDLPAMLRDGDRSMENDFNAKRQMPVAADMDVLNASLAISLSETASVLHHLPGVRGQNIVVAGTGIAGLAFGLWLKLGGARVITLGRRADRLEKARSMGADQAINTGDSDWIQQVIEASSGRVDGIIEATGDASLARELAGLLRPGGFASAYGVPPTGTKYASPWTASVAEEFLSFDWVLDLIRRGWVKPGDFITHTWDFDDVIPAFEAVQRGDVFKGFVRINPGSPSRRGHH